MNISKKDFVNSLKAAVIADDCSGVENIKYQKEDGTFQDAFQQLQAKK